MTEARALLRPEAIGYGALVAVLASMVSFLVLVFVDRGRSEGFLAWLWVATILPATACLGVASTLVYNLTATFRKRPGLQTGVLLANSVIVAALPWAALVLLNAGKSK